MIVFLYSLNVLLLKEAIASFASSWIRPWIGSNITVAIRLV